MMNPLREIIADDPEIDAINKERCFVDLDVWDLIYDVLINSSLKNIEDMRGVLKGGL